MGVEARGGERGEGFPEGVPLNIFFLVSKNSKNDSEGKMETGKATLPFLSKGVTGSTKV